MKAFQAIDDTLGSEDQNQGVVERRDRYYRKMLIKQSIMNSMNP